MSQEPVNIAGVCAFPNPNGVRDMRFVDCYYNTLFYLPNHSNIIITKPDGTQMKQQCSYMTMRTQKRRMQAQRFWKRVRL